MIEIGDIFIDFDKTSIVKIHRILDDGTVLVKCVKQPVNNPIWPPNHQFVLKEIDIHRYFTKMQTRLAKYYFLDE